eukprot:scaffold12617_cov91-Cylindrotheca_fusiformis.AAC.3
MGVGKALLQRWPSVTLLLSRLPMRGQQSCTKQYIITNNFAVEICRQKDPFFHKSLHRSQTRQKIFT